MRFFRPLLAGLSLSVATAPMVRAQEGAVAVADSLPAMSRGALGRASAEAAALRFAPYGDVAGALRRVYGDAAPTLLWSRAGVLTPSARATLDALLRLGDRGLDPAAFDVAQVERLATGPLRSEAEQFAFDAAMTAASVRTLRALGGVQGRNDVVAGGKGDSLVVVEGNTGIGGRPRAVSDSTVTEPVSGDELTVMVRTLAATTRPDSILDAAEPASSQYQLLKNAIATYRTLAERDGASSGQLMRILGTLERARVRREASPEAGVVVNIPAFQLHATGTDAADTLAMDVVVGVAASHRTPEMRDSIRYLVFAPYWEVPASIIKSELLPIARRDPYLLTVNNFQIIDKRGRVLPATVKSVRALETGRARIRQLPGGTNSLGRVKFMFPNADDIYLHDTPLQNDFARIRRDRSHGCVRVADPAALARLLLRDQPEWTAERIEAAMNGSTPVTVTLTRPVPVHLTYATAVARADGSVDFFDDVYGLDVPVRSPSDGAAAPGNAAGPGESAARRK